MIPSDDELRTRVADKRDELVDFTRALVRLPTVNPPGDGYRDCAELLGERLARRGFEVDYLRATGTPGDTDAYPRWNIVARREGSTSGPCVHFNSHIDVVAPGSGWSVDPFAAEVRDGRIYGRGTADMKGGLAASVIAVEALLEAWPDHRGVIEISGTADEESGGYGGVAWLAEQGILARPRVDHVIIPEPLNKDRICLGHRGVWWAEVETFGRQAHGSMPFLGDCAVRHMGAVLHAGLPSPLVPDACRMILDRRFLIEEDLGEVKQEVRDVLDALAAERDDFRYALRDLFEVIPTMTARDAPVVRSVAQAVAAVLGAPPEYVVSPGTYDQKHFDRIGRLHDCIAYGPGILDLAHQPDEWVGIDDMVDAAQVMALAARRLLSGDTDA